MTASQIAHQLHGVRAGKRWQCKCPNARLHAHGDRSRSLSVGEKNGWVTLKCFTGCEREEILAAMGLKLRDLALNERPDPKAQAEMERIRVKEATERKRIKANWRRVLEQAIYWRSRRDELGKLLHETPDSDKIASLFNAACYRAAHLSDSELHLLEKITWTTGLPFKTFNLSKI